MVFVPGLQFSYEKMVFKNNIKKVLKPLFFIAFLKRPLRAFKGHTRPLRVI